ncbi:isochorismatase family protein [Schumannella soli]|uniref:Isochorismatase family protein n=1 Tax=Schumannella soli TaxID=2590779 RepID=A0A506Y7W1_9MICO|nr:isochorismatase family protein [Schumannella soli]TPW76449.1 isochorismatase family protein [Schumannella soli]
MTLLIIDAQRDYFTGGAYPLVGVEAAGHVIAAALADARRRGERVVHVQHLEQDADAGFLVAGTDGAEIHAVAAPLAGETVVTKALPNAFAGTALAAELEPAAAEPLTIAGFMTSMCVDATTRAALDLGFDVTVVADGCAAPDLAFGGTTVDGRTVHTAFLAALRDAGARVVPLAEVAGG